MNFNPIRNVKFSDSGVHDDLEAAAPYEGQPPLTQKEQEEQEEQTFEALHRLLADYSDDEE